MMISLSLIVLPLVSAIPQPYSYHAQILGNHGFESFISPGRHHYSPITAGQQLYPGISARRISTVAVSAPAAEIVSPLGSALTSYIAELGEVEGCGDLVQAYSQSLLSGQTAVSALQAARSIFIRNFQSNSVPSPACLAAEKAFRAAYYAGREPVLPAAQAYLAASDDSDPCTAAAKTYVQSYVEGRSEEASLTAAAKSFSAQFSKQRSLDPVCTKAALAATAGTDSPTTAALKAFLSKAEEVGNSYDPVCAGAAEKFIESSVNGGDDERSGLEAARAFVKLYSTNPTAANNSPCAAAAKAFAEAQARASPTKSALTAFLTESFETNSLGLDPVCAGAAEAYLDSVLAGKSQAEADEAAAVAYVSALDSDPAAQQKVSPCSKAAEAYAANFRK